MFSACVRRALTRLPLVTAVLALAAGATASSAPADTATAASTTSYRTLIGGLSATGRQVLDSYIAQSSSTDPRFYADGVWMDPSVDCWTCYSSAGTAAAILSREGTGDAGLRAVAIRTFDRSIADHQNADGSFSGTSSGPGVDTMFWAGELGVAFFTLADRLDAATRTRWATALGRAADYLITAGHTTWYVNGNLNLRQAEILYLAWRATGEQRFKDAYEAEWSFLLAPPQNRWPGFGLQITKPPTKADGSDGAGYLAEQGTGAPGYDPAYTYTQLDFASSLYVVSQDARALRLMNLEVNQLLQRVDAQWTLDATNGSRKSFITPFMTPAISILVHNAKRPDLAVDLPGQFTREQNEFRGAMTYTHPNFYKGLSGWIGTAVLDGQRDTQNFSIPVVTPLAAPAPATRTAPAATTVVAAPVAAVRPVAAAPAPATPAWRVTKVAATRTAVTATVAGVQGASRVTAQLFASPSRARAARARPLRTVVARERAARFAVRVPVGGRRTRVSLRLTIRDRAGTAVVVRSVALRR